MYCKKCGKFLAGHINYCSNCGAKVEHDSGEDRVKVFAPVDDMHWDTPDELKKQREAEHKINPQHDHNWNNDPVYARIAEARKLREQRIPDVDVPSPEILEQEMEGIDREEIDDSKEKIEKFYTFSKKREEFQKLLDEEQERLEQKNKKPEYQKKLEDVMDFGTDNPHKVTDEVEKSQAAQMARARKAMFGNAGMDSTEWEKFTDDMAQRQARKKKQEDAISREELARQEALERQKELVRQQEREKLARTQDLEEQIKLAKEKEMARLADLERREQRALREEREHEAELRRLDREREQRELERRLELARKSAERNIDEAAEGKIKSEDPITDKPYSKEDISEDKAEVVFVDTPKTVELTEEDSHEKANDRSNHFRSDDLGHRPGTVAEVRDVTGTEGKTSAEKDSQGEKADSQGTAPELGGGEEASKAGTEGQNRLATPQVNIDPKLEKEKSEQQAKAEEFWQDEASEDEGAPQRSPVARFFIGLLVVVIIILACLVCIRLFMPNSIVSQYMDTGTKTVYSWLGIDKKTDDSSDTDDPVNDGAKEKSSLISLESEKNYRHMLDKIESDTDLIFTSAMADEHVDLTDLAALDNRLFLENEGQEILMDQVVVSRTIDYMSKVQAYFKYNDRAVFGSIDKDSDMKSVLEEKKKKWNPEVDLTESIDIGEIRQKRKEYYVLINDKTSNGESKKKVLVMREVGKEVLVSNRLELQ